MKGFVVVIILLCPFVTGCAGCTGFSQPNSGSQALDYSDGQGFSPTTDPHYIDGQPLDGRKGAINPY